MTYGNKGKMDAETYVDDSKQMTDRRAASKQPRENGAPPASTDGSAYTEKDWKYASRNK